MFAWLVCWLALAAAFPAAAHEVRPAALDIQPGGRDGWVVTWRQPATGDLAVRLDPRLSNGWLDGSPADQQATDTYLVRTWRIARGAPPVGVTVSAEGLAGTLTDVFVRARLADGRTAQAVLRPDAPSARLGFGGTAPQGLLAFFTLGVGHILGGPDHLLFVLGLLLLVRDRWMLLKTVTAFTVAHSLTLAAAVLGGIAAPPALLNALVALSILFVAVEVVHARRGQAGVSARHPWLVAFGFGLLHGMGFAGGLTTLGLPQDELVPALAAFNVGVEAGQLAFLALVFGLRRAFRLMALNWPAPVRRLPEYVIGALGAMWSLQYAAVALGAAS